MAAVASKLLRNSMSSAYVNMRMAMSR